MPTRVSRQAARSPALDPRRVRRIADAMLESLDLEDAELSVLLTDDVKIRELNRVHREQDRPTDVLSFTLDEAAPEIGARLLGDVVISLDTAQRQAKVRRRSLLAEVRFLLAHGLLHLLGYDHGNRRDKQKMVAMTRRLVRAAPHDRTSERPTRH